MGVDQDVRRLDVAVDQPERMGVRQRVGQRGGPAGRPSVGRPARLQLGGQVAALDQLGDQVQHAVDLPGVVDGDDVRVPQRGDGPGLAEEPLDVLGRRDHPGAGPLQRHGAAEGRVIRAMDHPEGPLPEDLAQLVPADRRRPRQGLGAGPREPAVRPPERGGLVQAADDLGVAAQVGEPVEVGPHRGGLPGPDPVLQLLVHQLGQIEGPPPRVARHVVLDRGPLAAAQGGAEPRQRRLQLGPDPAVDHRRQRVPDPHRTASTRPELRRTWAYSTHCARFRGGPPACLPIANRSPGPTAPRPLTAAPGLA